MKSKVKKQGIINKILQHLGVKYDNQFRLVKKTKTNITLDYRLSKRRSDRNKNPKKIFGTNKETYSHT